MLLVHRLTTLTPGPKGRQHVAWGASPRNEAPQRIQALKGRQILTEASDAPQSVVSSRRGKAMAHSLRRVQDLAEQIELLETEERLELLRRVVTPELEFRLLAEDLHRKVGSVDPRALKRDVDRAVREVRSKRDLARPSSTK